VTELADSTQLIEHISKKIQSINISDWDEDYLQFVKQFTSKVILIAGRSISINGVYTIYQYYILQKNVSALHALEDLLSKFEISETAKKIINKCLQSIQNNESSIEHVRLLRAIAGEGLMPVGKPFGEPLSVVLTDIRHNCTDSATLPDRLNLLQRLLELNNSTKLKKEDVKELWDITIQHAESFDVLLRHFVEEFDKCKKVNESFISKEVRNYILFELLGGMSHQQLLTMTPSAYETFQVYFRQINHEQKAIELLR
jgi:hypothetical protein